MVLFHSLRRRLWQPLIWCLLSAGGVGFAAGEDISPSADELIQRAVDHNLEALKGKSGFTYTKASIVEELDSLGKVKERKEKVYEISCRAGKTYAKLVEVN